MKRVRVTVKGQVQGVGYRPTVYRYAKLFALSGTVKNTPSGVVIEVEGNEGKISGFLDHLKREPPKQAIVWGIQKKEIPATRKKDFRIIQSHRSGDLIVGMPPDLALCDDCLKELNHPGNRRHRYAFTNCTNCGPRFTIINELPYDRNATSMGSFQLCEQCHAEYNDPTDRRFDAQPNACPKCGPCLSLIGANGNPISGDPVSKAIMLLKNNAIIAVKGLGGYHFSCNALNDKAVSLLRKRKSRPFKPLGVMFPSIKEIREHCSVSKYEKIELESCSRPIVVLRQRNTSTLSPLISPDTLDVGAFLPYTPLHHLLVSKTGPLVMTSGNLSEEPIAKDEWQLKGLLGKIADYALIHNRPIVRRCDDSVEKMVKEKRFFIRRSRGFVPGPIDLPRKGPSILACGGDLKNCFCITREDRAFLSQHIGDLTEYPTAQFYRKSIDDLKNLLKIDPEIIAYDMHPDYLSSRYALKSDIKIKTAVQHHHAHIASCMCENDIMEKVIGVALDGTGYGTDCTVWGGEFLVADLTDYKRVGFLKPYPMPGGEEAIKKPVRMALSVLMTEFNGEISGFCRKLLKSIPDREFELLCQMIHGSFNSPLTSSAGRLFDAVSSILGLCHTSFYEGQAAIRLQALANGKDKSKYHFAIEQDRDERILDFGPMIREIIEDLKLKRGKSGIAARFHHTVAAGVGQVCEKIRNKEELNSVVLSGGVFQNGMLLKSLMGLLRKQDFEVYCHSRVSPNDSGLALGQAAVALARFREQRKRTK